MSDLSDTSILAAHINELDPAYRILSDLADPLLRAEAVKLIDFLRGEQLTVPQDVPPDALPYLRAAAEAAHPDRKCLSLLATRFTVWLAAVTPESRRAFLEGLASFGPALADLGDDGMSHVIAAVNRDPRTMACIGSYALTTKEIVIAIARLAVDAPVEWLQRLVGAVPVSMMEESKDAERLVPAVAQVPDALPALVILAEQNVSSAYGAAKALPGALKNAEQVRASFLEDFRILAETVGISSAGFVLDTLPGLYRKAGAERARAFVALAAECAREYGKMAGQAFLERKTAAAREA